EQVSKSFSRRDGEMIKPIAARLAQLVLFGVAAASAATAQAQQAIRIGELNSYKTQPAFLGPYRMGMELAVEQVNAAGGVNGRPLELIIRDDSSNPGDAVRSAAELVTRDKVDAMPGTLLSNIGLAGADYARHRKRFF